MAAFSQLEIVKEEPSDLESEAVDVSRARDGYAISFNNRAGVSKATINPHTLNFVKKLVSTFSTGVENVSNSVSGTGSSTRRSWMCPWCSSTRC